MEQSTDLHFHLIGYVKGHEDELRLDEIYFSQLDARLHKLDAVSMPANKGLVLKIKPCSEQCIEQ